MIDLPKLGRRIARAPRTLRTWAVNSNGFRRDELKQFLLALTQSGIAFLPVDQFAQRYRRHDERRGRKPPKKAVGLLKFDIHNDIVRPLEMARMLAAIGAPGLFLMMPRHPLNESFYDRERTWNILREIVSLGHEVGLHADLFHLISTYGDLYKGLNESLKDMRGRGLAIRAASVHGDTRRHIKAVKLQGNDFFEEEFRRTKWTGTPPKGEEFYAQHVRRYSHVRIAEECGLEYFAEVKFLHDGRPLSDEPMLYLSDNRRKLEIRNIPGRDDNLVCDANFAITPEFTAQAAAALRLRPFLALLHPQWYR
ncbi:MAG: hypothetical protein WBQ17_03920 [Rhizomicrobium sp.]